MEYEARILKYCLQSGIAWNIKNVRYLTLAQIAFIGFIWEKNDNYYCASISDHQGQTELLLTTLLPKFANNLAERKYKAAVRNLEALARAADVDIDVNAEDAQATEIKYDYNAIYVALYEFLTGEMMHNDYHVTTIRITSEGENCVKFKFYITPINSRCFSTWAEYKALCKRQIVVVEL